MIKTSPKEVEVVRRGMIYNVYIKYIEYDHFGKPRNVSVLFDSVRLGSLQRTLQQAENIKNAY